MIAAASDNASLLAGSLLSRDTRRALNPRPFRFPLSHIRALIPYCPAFLALIPPFNFYRTGLYNISGHTTW